MSFVVLDGGLSVALFNDSSSSYPTFSLFRVLSDVGAALQQQSNCAKDAIIKSTTSLMVSDQKSDNLAGSTSNNSSHSALNLRTATTTSTANRDKSERHILLSLFG